MKLKHLVYFPLSVAMFTVSDLGYAGDCDTESERWLVQWQYETAEPNTPFYRQIANCVRSVSNGPNTHLQWAVVGGRFQSLPANANVKLELSVGANGFVQESVTTDSLVSAAINYGLPYTSNESGYIVVPALLIEPNENIDFNEYRIARIQDFFPRSGMFLTFEYSLVANEKGSPLRMGAYTADEIMSLPREVTRLTVGDRELKSMDHVRRVVATSYPIERGPLPSMMYEDDPGIEVLMLFDGPESADFIVAQDVSSDYLLALLNMHEEPKVFSSASLLTVMNNWEKHFGTKKETQLNP